MIQKRPHSSRASIAPFLAMEVAREARLRAAAGQTIVRFDVGQPHVGAPAAAIEAAAQAMGVSRMGYTEALGDVRLREAISARYAHIYGVEVDPGLIVITTGASGAFVLAFLALFETGDRVAMAAPGYPPYRHILTSLGMAPVSLPAQPADGFHLTPDLLASYTDKLAGVLIASPANPTGAMIGSRAIAVLAAAAKARGAAFISDEIYHGLTYDRPAPTALAADPDAIVINSFSKYWAMTGWRVGWLIAPEALIKPIERLAQNLFICPPAPAQAAARAALEAEDECEARRSFFGANRARLLEALPQIGLAPLVKPGGAFYFFLDVSRFARDSLEFCARALDAGVALTPGVDFDEARGNQWVRLAYCVERDALEDGVARLGRLVT